MRIVMLGPFGMAPRGTMSFRALPLAQALVAAGHTVTLLLPPWQNPEDAGKTWEAQGVRVENLSLPVGVPGWFHWRLTVSLVRRTRALRPDIVHAFKPKAYAGLAHLALRRYFPVVVDTDDWEGPGGWNALNPYPGPLKRFFTWQERWGLSRAAAVTAASRALQTLAWSTGGAAERVFYLPNGVVPRGVVDLTLAGQRRPTVLLYTRFFEFDLERFWRVACALRERRPDARLWVLGKGFFGEQDRLLSMARAAGWRVATEGDPHSDADLRLCSGWIAPQDQLELFSQCDVALYPFDDTLLNRTKCPIKLLDILAAGLPVVADAVGQIKEDVQHGKTGLLVPAGDEPAFVEAVLSLLADIPRCRSMGERAAADMRARFGWADQARVAESAYTYALENS